MHKPIKTIFAGTPDFAVPFLKSLINDKEFEIVGVLTQPNKPVGRKQILTPPPVKELASQNNLNILQPASLKNTEAEQQIKELKPDLMVVVAYGLIIPQAILDIAPTINVHPSILPKYRGASPIQSAILNGDKTTGVTIMLMDEKMDHGPILAQEKIDLKGDETAESLHDHFAKTAPDFMTQTIKDYLAEKITPQEQDHEKATFCKTINKEEAKIDWQKSAEEIEWQIRGYFSWPVAWTTLDNKRLKIFPPAEIVEESAPTGTIIIKDNQLIIACGKDAIQLTKLQLEGKKPMTAEEFIRGQDINNKILN